MDRSLKVRADLEEAGVGILSSMPVAYACLKKIMGFAAYDPFAHVLATDVISPGEKDTTALNEAESKAEIIGYGVRVPAEFLAKEYGSVEAEKYLK